MPTIFSRIIAGEIPAVKLYEDTESFAFMDIAPASKGHALVVCKAEYADLLTIPGDVLAAVQQTTQKIALAIQATLAPDGINIVQNNGAAAGQTVFHYHVHIIPRWNSDGVFTFWQPKQADIQELQALAEQIRTAISPN